MASFSPTGPAVWFEPMATPAGSGIPSSPAAAAGSPSNPAPEGTSGGEVTPDRVEAVVGGPDLSGGAPAPVEPATMLDVKVGDVNGRPIFASDFFEDMERFLIEEARVKEKDTKDEIEDAQDRAGRISENVAKAAESFGQYLRAQAMM